MNETLLAKDWEGKSLGAGSIAGFLSPQNHHHNVFIKSKKTNLKNFKYMRWKKFELWIILSDL